MNEKDFATGVVISVPKVGLQGVGLLLCNGDDAIPKRHFGKVEMPDFKCDTNVNINITMEDEQGFNRLLDEYRNIGLFRKHEDCERILRVILDAIKPDFTVPENLMFPEIEKPALCLPEHFGLQRRNNSECNMRYGIYIENINNCCLAIYRLIVTPLFVTWELIRKVRFSVIQFVKVKSTLPHKPAHFFSGFKSNGLRHWFTGKGRRQQQ